MPGQTARENGKLGGRPKLEATKLREALYRKVEANADKLSDVIIKKAVEGDIPAWKEIADRVFGRAQQSVDHTTKGEMMPTPILAQVKVDATVEKSLNEPDADPLPDHH